MKQIRLHLVVFLGLVVFILVAGLGVVNGAENGTFGGLVVDVAGNPVVGAEAYIYTTSNVRRPADYIAPPSDIKGVYQITLPAGRYWAVVRIRQGGEKYGPLLTGDRHSGAPFEFDILPGEDLKNEFVVADLEETSRLAVKLDTTIMRVKGVLQDKNGEPVDCSYAFANRSATGKRIPDYVSTWTDSSGGYTLFLPPGTYYFGLARQFPPRLGPVNLQKVTIDKNRKDINIVIAE